MLATNLISDQQFLRARAELLPVRVIDERTFVIPSSSRPHLKEWHRIKFDSAEAPSGYTCTCEAANRGRPCWAAARALDVLVLFMANNIIFGGEPGTSPAGASGAAPASPPATASPAHFERRREFKVEPETDSEAMLVAPRAKKVERVRGFQI